MKWLADEAPKASPTTSGPQTETLLEIAADPVTWAAMMMTKVGKPGITVGEAMEQVRSIIRQAIFMSAAPDGIADLIKRAKAVLPEGYNIRVYIEPGFAYVYLQRPDQTVHNMDMHEKLTIAEQLTMAVSMLPPTVGSKP